jgi:ATP synthase protein I
MAQSKPLSSTELLDLKRRSVFRFIAYQLIAVCLISIVSGLIYGSVTAYSFLLGAFSSLLPSMYLAFRVFGNKGLKPAREIVRSFYRGEAGKLVLTATLVAIVFVAIKPLSVAAFFCGYGISILSHWLSPLFIKN